MLPLEIRSYSMALWLFARGHSPLEAGITPGGALVFTLADRVGRRSRVPRR